MTSILIVPDCHAHPEYDNDRFLWLNKYIRKTKPDIVVQLGDFGDLPSLCDHNTDLETEGQRYKADLASVHDAQEKLFWRVKKPQKFILLGNHEDRISRLIAKKPVLENFISLKDLKYEDFWDEIHPYKQILVYKEILFCHLFPSGVQGRPVGGENSAANNIKKQFMSCVFGHSHLFDIAERTRGDGKKLFGLSSGCYSHPKYKEGWCINTVHMWWRGIHRLEIDGEGYWNSLSSITMRQLREDYI